MTPSPHFAVSPIGRRLALGIALLALASTSAIAGPLRDRLRRRGAGRARSDAASEERMVTLPPGVRVEGDVPYGQHRRQRMDVYRAEQPQRTPAPVIFMVHGGGWRIGDKAHRGVVENKVTRWVPRGFVFISVNYRMLPRADPLEQSRDVARALAAAQRDARRWGADPSKFVLMGHSAGAHLVALLSSDPARAYAQGARPWRGTVVLDSAALDVEDVMEGRHLPLYDKAFGTDPGFWRSVCPQHALSRSALPMLLVCSSTRGDDSCGASQKFSARATTVGVRTSVLPQALSHGQVNGDLGLPGAYTKAVEAFMEGLLK